MGYYKYDASASRVVGQEKWSGYYWLWLERNIRVGSVVAHWAKKLF